MTRVLRIGTRGSELALVQARWVAARLADHGIATEIVIVRTEGDDRPADTAWGEGAFVGRIVGALLDGAVDVAVHSAKDVPTDEHPDLVIAAYPPREDPRDALVCRARGSTLATLPPGARIGTDSPRRTAFLHAARPDLQVQPLFGNVDTRLAKLDRGEADALVLAVAGLTRLGRADRIDEVLAPDAVAPAPGQGALAVQVRAGDAEALEAVGRLDDPATRTAVLAERALLAATGGGCRSPIGALGLVHDGVLELVAGAERPWAGDTVEPRLPVRPVGWVRGTAPVAEARSLAEGMAARIVALRRRPRALVARPAGQAGALLEALDGVGIDGVHVPAIAVQPAAPGGDLDGALEATHAGDWVVVTSANAAEAVVDSVERTGIDDRRRRWASVGTGTARVLDEAGVTVDFLPSSPSADCLGRELPLAGGDRVLLPRADIADPALPAVLRARGATVIEVVAYRTVEAPEASRRLLAAAAEDGPIDVLVLTSGSIARGLLGLAGDSAAAARLRSTPVVAIGDPTAAAARELGFAIVLVSPSPAPPTLAAFVAASLGLAAGGSGRGPHGAVTDIDDTGDRFLAAATTGGTR